MSEDTTTNAPMTIDDLKLGMVLEGTVTRTALYGAFVDIGIGQDALLHVSQLGRPDLRNTEDAVKVGDTMTVYVLKIDREANRVALSLEPTPSLTWNQLNEGDTVNGTVVRIEKFGVFVDIGAERPGMVHVSELADGYVNSPDDVVSVGQQVEARVLKINRKQRKIDLTMKSRVEAVEAYMDEDEVEQPTAMEMAFKRAMRDIPDEELYYEPEQSSRRRDRSNKGKDRRRRDREQDDIISRTLRDHNK